MDGLRCRVFYSWIVIDHISGRLTTESLTTTNDWENLLFETTAYCNYVTKLI